MYIAAINAKEDTKEYNVWEMIQEIQDGWKIAKNSVVDIYEGGNSPVVRKVSAGDIYKADIAVPQNDGVVIVFKAE